jgi:hypothetical protein
MTSVNRIDSSTSCSIWLPETSPPNSSRGVPRHCFQSCNTSEPSVPSPAAPPTRARQDRATIPTTPATVATLAPRFFQQHLGIAHINRYCRCGDVPPAPRREPSMVLKQRAVRRFPFLPQSRFTHLLPHNPVSNLTVNDEQIRLLSGEHNLDSFAPASRY